MKLLNTFIYVLTAVTVLSACKQDVKNEAEGALLEESIGETQDQKKPAEELVSEANSVMARVMTTTECLSFARYIVSAELADQLMKEEGPFTVFAPSDEAFKSLDAEFLKRLTMSENKPMLVSIVKSHLVNGIHDTVTLNQALKNGPVSFTTLSGEKLTLSMDGIDILMTDSRGNTAIVGKSDIQADNGVVHVVNSVLGVD